MGPADTNNMQQNSKRMGTLEHCSQVVASSDPLRKNVISCQRFWTMTFSLDGAGHGDVNVQKLLLTAAKEFSETRVKSARRSNN